MSQGCGRRQIVAAAGVAALMGLGSGLADAQQAAFARIAVSERRAPSTFGFKAASSARR